MLNLIINGLLSFLILLDFYATALTSDGLSLLTIKSAVDGGTTVFSDWNDNDATPCHWTGVTCANISGESDPRVVGLALAGRSLTGYIPSELGNLVYLRRLNLHNNNFYGSIPNQIFNATSLHSIFLYGNNLSGELPASICNPPRLQNVDFSHNSITGTLKRFLGTCRQLERLILAGNNFSGELPAGVFPELANLVQLDLSSNSFSGPLPLDIGQLKSLSGTLNLSFNNFNGELPESLGDLPLTVSFDLRHNNFTGKIPQVGSFANQGPTAFLNNPLLCGFPLQKTCQNNSPTMAPGGQSLTPMGDDNDSKSGLKPGLIILISVADAVGVALIGLIIVYFYWRKKDSNGCSCTLHGRFGGNQKSRFCSFPCVRGFYSTDSDLESEKGSGVGGGGSGNGGGEGGQLVTIDKGFSFELDELLRASAYVLGKSGLGIVYKVVLGNGIPVAVRRLGEGGEQRYKEFVTEVQAIGKVKHPNVVRLRAYYWAPDEKLLISDFISNGNLASALRGQASTILSWSTRLRITKGTARGLAYLHECSPRKFVHGDIKPSNILLDNEYQPYISDFGLNRLINITGNNPSSGGGFMGGALPYLNSTHTVKVNNYRAPEARAVSSRPTQKWDVYSFGVVLLELLTGKSPEHSSPTTSTSIEIPDLVKWVRKGFEEETPLSDMVDPMLLQEVHAKKELLTLFHLALSCTELDPEIRPRMKTVSESLDKIRT
ncbi:receptor protein kinase-like protein ZAR1 [Rutidosis leptorrhynchoides]|uniref:receptor protein kinase-like protein ZAR1 n=1 Tax=Rutidosis leptorrhynchoides TaxID=125765 RepID=UPI003A9A659E